MVIAGLLLIATMAPSAVARPVPAEVQETEMGFVASAVVIGVAFAAGMAAGWHLSEYLDDKSKPGAGDSVGREHEAELVHTILSLNSELIAHSIDGYSDSWRFTNAYWMRQAEVAAAERWPTGQPYSAQAITERAGLYYNMAQLMRNINDGPDATYELLNERLTAWQNTEGYDSMAFQLQYGRTSHAYDSALGLSIRPCITATADVNKVYLTGDGLWAFSTGTATAMDGAEYSLKQGHNELAGIVPGVYQLSAGSYAGGILPALAADACVLHSGAVISSPDGISLAAYDGGAVQLWGNTCSNLALAVDAGTGMIFGPISLMPVLQHYDDMIRSVEQSLTKASAAASAAWRIYEGAKESNILISPSSLVPDIPDMEISDEQMAILTTLYLRQVHDYYERIGGNLTATGWKLAPDSIDLYLRGNVYDASGTLLYESVVFTPYVWLDDWRIGKGTNTATQSGIIALWGETNDLSTWSGSSSFHAQIIAMEPHYQLEVAQLVHRGEAVDTIDLEIMSIEEWDPIERPEPWTPIHVLDEGRVIALIQLIGLLSGGLIVMVGAMSRRHWLALIGALVAIAIIASAGTIMGWL